MAVFRGNYLLVAISIQMLINSSCVEQMNASYICLSLLSIFLLESLSRNLSKLIVGSHFNDFNKKMHSMAFITAPNEEVAKTIAQLLHLLCLDFM